MKRRLYVIILLIILVFVFAIGMFSEWWYCWDDVSLVPIRLASKLDDLLNSETTYWELGDYSVSATQAETNHWIGDALQSPYGVCVPVFIASTPCITDGIATWGFRFFILMDSDGGMCPKVHVSDLSIQMDVDEHTEPGYIRTGRFEKPQKNENNYYLIDDDNVETRTESGNQISYIVLDMYDISTSIPADYSTHGRLLVNCCINAGGYRRNYEFELPIHYSLNASA